MKKLYPGRSNRFYPKKKCKHCMDDFIPSDAREKYCCVQHRIDYNNDLRRLNNAPLENITQGLKKNEAILKKGYLFMQEHKNDAIAIDFLQYDGYDFDMPYKSSKSKTGNKIEWQLSYGLEGIDKGNKLFKIHKQ